MDLETLQALIGLFKSRPTADLLAVILDSATSMQAQSFVLELLQGIQSETLSGAAEAKIRQKAARFCLQIKDFQLAERLAGMSELPEDRMLRVRALSAQGRSDEAINLYREAVAEEPSIADRDVERMLGLHQAQPAQIISLTNYSHRRESRNEIERRDALENDLDDFDENLITFANVCGLDHIKSEIRRRIILPYLKPSLFERYRRKPGGNLLIYGPPGCGKTLVCRAAAGETDARFISIAADDIFDRYGGEAEKRLRSFFEEARSDTPAILFFDDFESLAGAGPDEEGDAPTGLVRTFLAELDGTLRNNEGLLVLATTGAPWRLHPALFRPGKFHDVLYAGAPDDEAKSRLLAAAIDGVAGSKDICINKAIRKAAGSSCADIRAAADYACDEALRKALAGAPEAVLTQRSLEAALISMSGSAQAWLQEARRWARLLPKSDLRRTALLEAFA